MAIYYQHPFELESEPRVQKVFDKMWFTGIGIWKIIYEKLKLGKGTYPVDSIMATAGGKKSRERQIQRVLTEFDLFTIENGMISLREGLNTSHFIHKESIAKKTKKANELENKDYSDNIFPEESKALDLEAARQLKEEIKEQTAKFFKE